MDFTFSEEQQAIGDLAGRVLGDRSTHERLRARTVRRPRFGRGPVGRASRTRRSRRHRARGARGEAPTVALGAVLESHRTDRGPVPLWDARPRRPAIAHFAPASLAAEVLAAVAGHDG